MTVISIELSEEVAARLSALPEGERNHFATQAVAEALEQREAEEREAAECVAAVEASFRETDAGGRLYTLEEEIARFESVREGLIHQVNANKSSTSSGTSGK